jgi:hypothetical protein
VDVSVTQELKFGVVRISEFVEFLSRIKAEHGDVPVFIEYDGGEQPIGPDDLIYSAHIAEREVKTEPEPSPEKTIYPKRLVI